MNRSRFSKLVSVVITGVIAISGLPSMVLADVINSPTYYSVQSELDYEITTNITSSWINHESIDLVLTNTGSGTIHNWYLTFNTPYNIENIWNGTIYETDGNGTYTITSNGWNQDIHTGESVTVGITFSSDTETELSVDPTWYLLNTQATVVDASQYTLEYTEYSAWETGFTGQLTLTPQVDCQHWELSFDSNRDITAVSSAVLLDEGDNNYTITHDENNMRLLADTAYNFGIQGDNTEYPLEFSTVELTVVDLAYHLTDDFNCNSNPDYLDLIGSVSALITPTTEPTSEITEDSTASPTPVEDDEDEQVIFPYAIFAGSTTDDFSFRGWKSDILGDVYSGRDFLYQGSELYMEGYARTVGTVQPAGWITDMTGAEEGIYPIEMPDWSESILAKYDLMPAIAPEAFDTQDSILANGFYYTEDSITINGTTFTGDAVIVARGDITYNVNSLTSDEETTGRILLYSEEGNITINGSRIEVNGILYAPQGRVSINAYNTTINGRIVADQFSYNGSILNVYADSSDLQIVNDLPEVDVAASSNQVYIGDYAYFTIEIPEDNVFDIHYRFNGESVYVDEPTVEGALSTFNLITDNEGTYTLEAYVVMPYGEFVLDSDYITVLSAIESTDTPTPTEELTPTPTSIPTTTVAPICTSVMSQGDTRYGYETEFIEEDWNIHNNTTYSPSIIRLTDGGTYRNGYAFFNHSQHIDDHYSFSLRYTYQIDLQSYQSSDGIAFVMQTGDRNPNSMGSIGQNIGYQGLNPSLEIESDVYSNWEINNHHIAVVLNANSGSHSAVADYPQLRDNDAVHTMWIDYDGFNDMLYVYVATYNEENDIEKPTEPLIAYNIDITDLFGETDEIYMGFTSASGGYMARCSVIGMEYSDNEASYIELDSNHYGVVCGDSVDVYGSIRGHDSTMQLIDSEGNLLFNEEIDASGNYERLFSISSIGLDVGEYTIIVTTVTNEGEYIYKEIGISVTMEFVEVSFDSLLDTDGDGLVAYEEAIYGTDPNNPDTDNDGVSDGYEIRMQYNPSFPDSNHNSVIDGDEDYDSDGISNSDEELISTNPCAPDSDYDCIGDYDEVFIYNTDPNNTDSDEDYLIDGDELLIGTDPLLSSTYGMEDSCYMNYYSFDSNSDQTIGFNVNNPQFSFSFDLSAAGAVEKYIQVNQSGYTNVLSHNDYIVGNCPCICYDANMSVDNVVVRFEMNSDYSSSLDDYSVFYYWEGYNLLIPIESYYDYASRTIYAHNGVLGTYCLVNTSALLGSLTENNDSVLENSLLEETRYYDISGVSIGPTTIYDGHEYFLISSSDALSYEEAVALCADYNGYPATIVDSNENQVVENVADNCEVWLGADMEKIGNLDYRINWLTGEDTDYTAWGQNYMVFLLDLNSMHVTSLLGLWFLQDSIYETYWVVCERECGSDISPTNEWRSGVSYGLGNVGINNLSNSDIDNDGLLDYQELSIYDMGSFDPYTGNYSPATWNQYAEQAENEGIEVDWNTIVYIGNEGVISEASSIFSNDSDEDGYLDFEDARPEEENEDMVIILEYSIDRVCIDDSLMLKNKYSNLGINCEIFEFNGYSSFVNQWSRIGEYIGYPSVYIDGSLVHNGTYYYNVTDVVLVSHGYEVAGIPGLVIPLGKPYDNASYYEYLYPDISPEGFYLVDGPNCHSVSDIGVCRRFDTLDLLICDSATHLNTDVITNNFAETFLYHFNTIQNVYAFDCPSSLIGEDAVWAGYIDHSVQYDENLVDVYDSLTDLTEAGDRDAIIDILVNNWGDIYGGRNGQVYLSRSGDWSDDFYLGNCDMAYRLTVYEYIDEEGQGHNAILSFFVEPAGYEDENGFDPVLH